MLPKDSPKKGSGYWSASTASSDELPKKYYFLSKRFVAAEPREFPSPEFQGNKQ